MFESRAGVLLVAGLGFFLFSFISNGLVPVFIYRDLPEQKVAELVNENLMYEWEDLARRFPEPFKKHFGEATKETAAEALTLGRATYVAEGCWHCHSQFVRPVSNESRRFGPVSRTEEYQNELQRPVMFGTRRVGPDLSREGGRRSSDWHAVHFFHPQTLSTRSPMPDYPWFFDGAPDRPNKRGLAIITYVQWLGSWLETFPYHEDYEAVPGMDLRESLPPRENPAAAAESAKEAATKESATDESVTEEPASEEPDADEPATEEQPAAEEAQS